MIVLDLEWNRGYDKTPLDEILQIGAVRLDRPGGTITGSFCVFIRPKVHKSLNRTAKALPEIQSALCSTLDFQSAYQRFLHWCGSERDFAAWGCDEIDTLNQNAAYWGLPLLEFRRLFDLQTAFSLTVGTTQNIALWWAVEHCQIPESFTYHDALSDAVYTAMTTYWIAPEFLELSSRPRWALRYLLAPYPSDPGHRVGPCSTLRAALNSRAGRMGQCPSCGKQLWVQAWDCAQQGNYFADLRCSLHGHFICRLTLRQTPDGRWQGQHLIPALTDELLNAYGQARAGLHIPCSSGGQRRKRYHRTNRKDKRYA